MISGHRSGSFAAYQLEQASDAAKVTKEIESFIGKDLKPVTVLLVKAWKVVRTNLDGNLSPKNQMIILVYLENQEWFLMMNMENLKC